MKRILFIIPLLIIHIHLVQAQNSIQNVLEQIEVNNKLLKAAKQSAQIQKIDAKTGIYPSDISVEYEYLFGNEASAYQRESELTVKQDFDFPTSYYQKNKIANMRSSQADIQYMLSRQDILLEAKQLCIELVYYNKMKEILTKRLENADKLNNSYKRRLDLGDANALETNKIALELLNVQTEYRLNDVEITNRMQRLEELNGGLSILFSGTNYSNTDNLLDFESLLQESLVRSPEINNLEQEKEIASRSVSLAKSMALPKISVGYKMSISNPEKFHGFVAGISLPLWENKNTVKLAKAQSILNSLEIDNSRLALTNRFSQLWDKMNALKKSNDEYQQLLSTQNNLALLDKALSLGQISLLEYLTEVNFLYQSTENFLQTEKDYHLTVSELLKMKL